MVKQNMWGRGMGELKLCHEPKESESQDIDNIRNVCKKNDSSATVSMAGFRPVQLQDKSLSGMLILATRRPACVGLQQHEFEQSDLLRRVA